MTDRLSRNMQATLTTLANQGGQIRIYEPDAAMDGRRLFRGRTAALTGLINRGLVEVIDHQVWRVTPAGRQEVRR